MPACLSRHGAAQVQATPLIARLNGQNAIYLESRLGHFAQDSSIDLPGLNPMHSIASALNEDQRAAVAAWFAPQPPLEKQEGTAAQ